MDRIKEREEITGKVERAIADLREIKQRLYWGFVAEHELGLLDGSILLLERLRKDM